MFEKMIESESGTHAGNRGRYFLVSALAVGALFTTAVAFSLYAADFDLGVSDLEISRIVAPNIVEPPPEAEPAEEVPQQTSTESAPPARTEHIAQLDEHQKTPATISVTPSTVRARPDGYYEIGPRDFQPPSYPGGITGPGIGHSTGGPESGASGDPAPVAEVKTTPPPPVQSKPPTQSKGVINGLATSLPQPPYPPTARTMRVTGNVSVQVTISETGKIISAKAVSGHALLKDAAEKAAWNARFTPTFLTGQPVKVTGVIIYKFNIN